MALSDFPTVFLPEPAPSTSATATSSTVRIVKTASLIRLPSILKQGTSDVGSSGPAPAKFVTISIHNEELEKKTLLQSIDAGRQLACRKPLCEKHGVQQKENSKQGPTASQKSSPIKSVVKTARSDAKPPISPSSELGISSGSEEEDGWGKKVRMKLVPDVYSVLLCSLKTTTVKKAFDAKTVYSGHTVFVRTIRSGPLFVASARNGRQLFVVAAKCYAKLHFVILINRAACFWPH